MHELILNLEQEIKFLYYEPGMTHQIPEFKIIDWMAAQGYGYGKDWFCVEVTAGPPRYLRYALRFPNAEIMSAFLVRWS